jgi:hypothetical protein
VRRHKRRWCESSIVVKAGAPRPLLRRFGRAPCPAGSAARWISARCQDGLRFVPRAGWGRAQRHGGAVSLANSLVYNVAGICQETKCHRVPHILSVPGSPAKVLQPLAVLRPWSDLIRALPLTWDAPSGRKHGDILCHLPRPLAWREIRLGIASQSKEPQSLKSGSAPACPFPAEIEELNAPRPLGRGGHGQFLLGIDRGSAMEYSCST